MPDIEPIDELRFRLVGRRLPSGDFRVPAHRAWLHDDALGSPELPAGTLHPMWLFHAALTGLGLTIEEIFALGGIAMDEGPMGAGVQLHQHRPMLVGEPVRVHGIIEEVARKHGSSGTFDLMTAAMQIVDRDGQSVGSVHNAYVLPRRDVAVGSPRRPASVVASPPGGVPAPGADAVRGQVADTPEDARVGDRLPERRIDPVKRWPMKVLALVLDDPNPLHWDPASVAALGLGDRPVNQGPMSMGWIVDMLVAWVGDPARVCDVSVRFRGNVFAGDVVVAGGRVEALESAARGRVATCAVWLVRDDGTPLVSGSASVELGQ